MNKSNKNRWIYSLYMALIALILPLRSVQAQQSVLQQKITISFKQAPLRVALDQLGSKVNRTLSYSSNQLPKGKLVTKSYHDTPFEGILNDLLDQKLDAVKVSGDKIVFRIKEVNWRGPIEGRVFGLDSLPVAGAAVHLPHLNLKTVTDESGNFIFSAVPEGMYTMVVNSIGYQKQELQAPVKKGQNLKLHIDLQYSQNSLQQIDILGQREPELLKASGFNMNAVQLKSYYNSSKDLNQVLSATTGVRIRENGGLGSDFNFSINGLSGKAVRFFIDGVPMEYYGTGMNLNNIPVNLADRLEIFKGVVPVEFGADALGGAVNVSTQKGVSSYLDASYSYGSFHTHRASLNAQYRHTPTGFISRFIAFHNISDNNYIMHHNPDYDAPIRVPDPTGTFFIEQDQRRFHDRYRSSMVQGEVGLVDQSWADVLMLSMLYNDHYKEFQTGATQNIVYGAVHRRGDYWMPSLRYKKDNLFIQGLSATAFVGYGKDKYVVTDTASNTYYWDGNHSKISDVKGELNGINKTINSFRNAFLLSRVNIEYKLHPQHRITFNFNHSSADRKSEDEISGKRYDPSRLSKSVYGLAWKSRFLADKLTNTLFAKLFHFNVGIESNSTSLTDRTYNNYGYGLASRYLFHDDVGIRVSYEQAYRLPEQIELLGDGVNVISNLELRPESSRNLNVGTDYTFAQGKHRYDFTASAFMRHAVDFIYTVPWGTNYSRYLNEGKVFITGGEIEGNYRYNELLSFTINATYQKSKQNQEYILGSTRKYETYGNAIPNQPWFFGNAQLSLGKNDWLSKDSRIQLDWSTQYVHWFFLNWEAYGSRQSQNKIPTQFIQHAGITYSWGNGRYHVTGESRNLTDRLAYDNFRLQKPGRSFNIKLRYYIH